MDDVIGQKPYAQLDAGRQCTAISKTTGQRCERAPIVGGFVCNLHGGRAPNAIQAARERLLAMVDPAMAALRRVLESHGPPCPHCGRSDADRDPTVVRAAQIVLDRTGFGPHATMEITPTPDPITQITRVIIDTLPEDGVLLDDDEPLRLGAGNERLSPGEGAPQSTPTPTPAPSKRAARRLKEEAWIAAYIAGERDYLAWEKTYDSSILA